MRYRCHECEKTYYPLDEELELSLGSRMSLQKEQQLALLAVHMPYEEAKKVYEELTQLKTGTMTVHRTVQRLGSTVLREPTVAVQEEPKQENKRNAQETLYTATLGSREQFGNQLYRLAGEPEAAQTSKLTFISDAAKWLDELQVLAFPLATRIVDFWHVTEYLWKVANAFYEEGSTKAKAWAHGKIELLRQGQAKLIAAGLAHMKPKTKLEREVLNATQTYFRNHAHQMDYPRYEAMGLHIGSGVGEAACKFVIQTRFKRSGMRWSRPGAENLLQLRLAYVNNQWDRSLETMKN